MADKKVLHAHWSTLVEGLSASSMEMYSKIEEKLKTRQMPDASFGREQLAAGGILSGKREYLRVRRKEFIVDICAAPFGTGFFFSSWLIEPVGCIGALAEIPVVGFLLDLFLGKFTYYHHDTATMFYTAVHQAVIEVVDEATKASPKGLRMLSERERTPVLRALIR